MKRDISDIEMKSYFENGINFLKTLVLFHKKATKVLIEGDLKKLKKGTSSKEGDFAYSFSEKDELKLIEILERSVTKKINVNTSKADLLMIESYVLRLNLKIDPEIADFEKSKINPYLLLEVFEKEEKKFLKRVRNQFMNQAIKALEEEGKEASVENIHDIVQGDKKDIESYLKRVSSLYNNARTKNSKVK